MTPCDGTSTSETWCCGRQNTTCCAGGSDKAIILAPTRGVPTAPISTITAIVTVTAAQALRTNVQNTTQLNAQQSSSGTSQGAAAGIAIGILIGGMLIGGLASWFVTTRREREIRGLYAKPNTTPLSSSSRQDFSPVQMPVPSMRAGAVHALGVVTPPAEMDDYRRL